jgi:hypothetical protein
MSKDEETEISISPSVIVNPYQSILNAAPAIATGNLMLSSSQALGSQFLANALQIQINSQMASATCAKAVTEIFESGLAERDELLMKIAALVNNNI